MVAFSPARRKARPKTRTTLPPRMTVTAYSHPDLLVQVHHRRILKDFELGVVDLDDLVWVFCVEGRDYRPAIVASYAAYLGLAGFMSEAWAR